ncbi:unnamed protein product [Paramecium pentaurelia]|uniref:Transmembrane protein n=1 Tax=Paramecium pentaurelia TaxID=43138 RepID=A0A8S1XSS8_9CILI|nr:unnamed protein product [Paramecium pentaurelia]
MNFLYFFSAFPFNILQLISITYQQTEYFVQGETKFTNNQRYFVPFEQNLLDSNESQFQIELIHEEKIENQVFINITEQMKLFYFQHVINEEDNMIMVMDNSSLYCLYIIKDYLLNSQLVITPHFCNITLPYQSCKNLIQVNQQIYIINCQLNENQQIISIINLDGIIYDQIQLEIEDICQIDFSYRQSYIFIFEQNCKSNNIYQVEIDQQIYQYKSIKKIELFQENNITYTQYGYLRKIIICQLDRIFIIFQKLILNYNMKQNQIIYYSNATDAIILNVFEICQKSNLILDVENSSKELRIDKNLLNLSSSKYKNSFIIEKILVLHFNDYIFAKINNQLQQKINLSILEILPLFNQQYFVGVYQSQLRLFQIQPPRTYNQFISSQKILYLNFGNQIYLQDFILEQSYIEILKQNEVRVIMNQQENIIYQNNDSEDICFKQSQISQSLPIYLKAIIENNKYVQINQTLYIENCKINYHKYMKMIYFGKLNDQINMCIMFKQEDIITFIFCNKSEIIQEKSIKLIKKIIIDLIIVGQGNTLIIYEKTIQLITIDDSLQLQITNFPQENKIIKIAIYLKYISILYENCKLTIVYIDVNKLLFMEESQYYLFNCNHYYKILNSQILISQNEIIYLSKLNRRYQLEGKIIEVLTDELSLMFVIFVEEENEIKLRLYRQIKTELIQQYIIPTYNFKYQPSFSQKFQNFYLMISAKNQNKLYLLVYNLRNSAINSLIFITEIDENSQFYQIYEIFDDKKRILIYYYNEKIFYHQLNQICFKYSIQQQNIFRIEKELEVIVNSYVGNQSVKIKMQIQKLNHNYTLATLNKTQHNYFLQETLNWDLIKGNIVTADINQDFIVKLPLNITQQHLICQYFESSLCLNNQSLKEIKSLIIIDNLTLELIHIQIKGIIFNQELLTYYVFYHNNHNLDYLMVQLEKNDLDQFVIIQKKTVQSILSHPYVNNLEKVKLIKDILYFQIYGYKILLFYKDICQLIGPFLKQDKQFYYIDSIYLSNQTYIIVYWFSNKIKIYFITVNDKQLILQQYCKTDIIKEFEIDLSLIFGQVEYFNFDIAIQKIEIFYLEKKGHIYVVKFILIYHTQFSQVFEFSFDDIQYDNFKIKSHQFLRYEKQSQFIELLYADDNFIVATFEQNNKQFVNVYDIKVQMNNKDFLDSIQRLESYDYKRIEKFNQSHYVIYNHINGSLYFMTLNQFKVECVNECTQNAKLILSNDVSTLTLEIQLVNSLLLQNALTIQSGILIVNIIFILIFLKYGKKANRNSLQNNLKTTHL